MYAGRAAWWHLSFVVRLAYRVRRATLAYAATAGTLSAAFAAHILPWRCYFLNRPVYLHAVADDAVRSGCCAYLP